MGTAVEETTMHVRALLRGLNETMRDSVVAAAATVGEMHALMTPKCRGELQVRLTSSSMACRLIWWSPI